MTKKLCLLYALALLTACGDDRPPVPTAEESDQLNATENLLNESDNQDSIQQP